MEQHMYLSVEGLKKRFNDINAVDGISFSVQKGEVFGLLGPNGAGKTTTIKILCGLMKADAGNITFGGVSVLTDYNGFKARIGLCPQDIIIWELLTCLEQLIFVGMSYGQSSNEAKKNANNLLEILKLAEKRNKLAKTLSGGMQRRLNIALALVHDPDLIILDEPQAGLDPQGRILVRDFIRQLARKKTVILTTHDMDEADRLSDRVAIIDHGKILALDTPSKLKEKSGFGDILQIRISGTADSRVRKLMDALPVEFTEKKYSDGLLLLGASEVLSLIPKVSTMLKAFGIDIDDITVRKRTLEDAFIAMTGRGLRE
jgi:ABC-2 type transport system ATP-binding protein